MDEPYPGEKRNYIESSGTAVFTYGSIRTVLLEESYRATTTKAWHVILDDFVQN